jgi:TIR domain/Tetratricopeptide repeat/NB-ARC domain
MAETADDSAAIRVFVSYAGVDTDWAEWVAWQLSEAGYDVELDAWDWQTGDNFVARMSAALDAASVVVALWSKAYFETGRFTQNEWSALVARRGANGTRLVPLFIADPAQVPVPAILSALVTRQLYGLDEAAMLRTLLAAVGGPHRPAMAPPTPRGAATQGPRLPGSLPALWNVPPRSAMFTGRDGLLTQLRERTASGGLVAAQALHGMGGIGKTLLASEFAHRYAADYDVVWWVDAEQPGLIGEQFANLATAAEVAGVTMDVPAAAAAVMAYLRRRGRWLVVFDNAEDPSAIRSWLPEGGGHVLITSRNPAWAGVAVPIEVDVFSRPESVRLLKEQVPSLTDQDADQVAERVGDLPLALAQAAGVLAETGITPLEYLHALQVEAAQVMEAGTPATYNTSLAAVVRVASAKLGQVDQASVQFLHICAFLAPEPVPISWFSRAAASSAPGSGAGPAALDSDDAAANPLPEALAAVASSAFALAQLAGRLARYGLARVTAGSGPVLHALTAAITRQSLTPAQQAAARAAAEWLLVVAAPGDTDDASTWAAWAIVLPHLIALDPSTTSNADLHVLACKGIRYLLVRGDPRTAHDLAAWLHGAWSQRLGPSHRHTLLAASNLAQAHTDLGDYRAARALSEDTLTRRRRVLGDDHPDTLRSANGLANTRHALGDHQAARTLHEDTLARRRRVLGEDHPDTLRSATNLAITQHALGNHQAAAALEAEVEGHR